MKRLAAFLCVTLLAGCSFKTRAELAAEETARGEQLQTVAQQRETAAEGPAKLSESPAPKTVVVKPAPPAEEDMDTQMRNLNGRVDSLENLVSQQAQGEQGKQENLAKEKAAIDQKFKDYEEALKKLELQVQALNEEVTKLKTAPPPPPPPVVETPAAVKKTAWAEGEEHFAAKKWKEAIVAYQKYRDTNPKGKQYPEATYKIGVSFQELGMKDEARAFYEEVQSKFPKSADSRKAGIRLKTLK